MIASPAHFPVDKPKQNPNFSKPRTKSKKITTRALNKTSKKEYSPVVPYNKLPFSRNHPTHTAESHPPRHFPTSPPNQHTSTQDATQQAARQNRRPHKVLARPRITPYRAESGALIKSTNKTTARGARTMHLPGHSIAKRNKRTN